MDTDAELGAYTVLVNTEGQYSLSRWGVAPPLGWRTTGRVGSKAQGLTDIIGMMAGSPPCSAGGALDNVTVRE